MKQEYEMTQEQRDAIWEASRPVAVMMIGGVMPSSPQENANRAWRSLGKELKFKYETVEPVSGKSDLFFRAEPS